MTVREQQGATVLVAYRGDAKTMLAFDLKTEASRDNLAGFTVRITPPGKSPYYMLNNLRFEHPEDHAQDPAESAFSTLNAPIHKFRWVHVPGQAHQSLDPAFGEYTYEVTPRHFAAGRMKPLDPSQTATAKIEVGPFVKGKLAIGFTRGFTQSQAFVRHFGLDALIRPKDAGLQFDTSAICGANAQGEQFTYAQQYAWSGFTARKLVFDTLTDVLDGGASWSVDIFAYDLNEPDLVGLLLKLGASKQARIILDNAGLHHDKTDPKPEDEFADLFVAAAGADRLKRGHFGRYAHDKVLVVSRDGAPARVLTGSTNFSVTGMYVNSNHVLVFEDDAVARQYADVFALAWENDVHPAVFRQSALARQVFGFGGNDLPQTSITFAPHDEVHARQYLKEIVDRVASEPTAANGHGSVLFAVMELDGGPDNPVYDALNALHASQALFSFGISDDPKGIALYPIGKATGVLVTGKPMRTQLPPPFSQVRNISGVGHQVHHKFVVCGFNRPDAVVFCGSSNLALKGEQVNGDNLLAIRDDDVATVFAIEALGLIDHFNFLNGVANAPMATRNTTPSPLLQQAAVSAGWFLGTTDAWAHKFFDPHDLHFKDRELFVA